MILVDSSIWIDHLRQTDAELERMLIDGLVLIHPFVIGELAVGRLRDPTAFVSALRELPSAIIASDDEVLALIDKERLAGLGIGYLDAHLLAATRLTPGAALWSRDRRLRAAAERLGVGA